MREPYKNPNFNARFAAAGFCAIKFMDCGVKFYPCGAEPEAHDAKLRDFKFCDEKFNGAKFATYGTEFLGANFHSVELRESKFKERNFKFYRAKLRETDFLARTAEFCGVKFHKARLRRAKFYTAEFAAKGEKFCGMKRRGASA